MSDSFRNRWYNWKINIKPCIWVELHFFGFVLYVLHASYLVGTIWFFIQVAENLAQLMYSVMMTGYMFRNAQYRLELQESLEQVALPDVQDKKAHHFSSLSFWDVVQKLLRCLDNSKGV
jgi:hypothetical protein